jgi:hypothetical protein
MLGVDSNVCVGLYTGSCIKMKSKYMELYINSRSIKDFIRMAQKKFPDVQQQSLRRKYDKINFVIKNKQPRKKSPEKKQEIPIVPKIGNTLRQIKLNDMYRFNIKITDERLRREGFTDEEIIKIMGAKEHEKTEDEGERHV